MENILEIGMDLSTQDSDKVSEWIISLYEKHNVKPENCHAETVDNSCCAVGIISKELGSNNGGCTLFAETFGNSLMWGLISGFDSHSRNEPRNEKYNKGYEIGKLTRQKLIMRGKL